MPEWTQEAVRAYIRPPNPEARVDGVPVDAVEAVVEAAVRGNPLAQPVSKAVLDAAVVVGLASGDDWVLQRIQAVLVEAVVEVGLQRDPEGIVALFGSSILASLQLEEGVLSVSFLEYLGLGLKGRYAFPCQEVVQGRIRLGYEQLQILVARCLMQEQHLAPLDEVPAWVKKRFARSLRLAQKPMQRRGRKREEMARHGLQPRYYPPCIKHYLHLLESGEILSHPRRFNLVTFLHHYGATTTQLVDLFRNAPDFDESKTRYQVEHIAGKRLTDRKGRGYGTMACRKMRAYGICPDHDCPGTTPINQYHYAIRAAKRAG